MDDDVAGVAPLGGNGDLHRRDWSCRQKTKKKPLTLFDKSSKGIMREDDVTLSVLEKQQEREQDEDMEEEEEEYVMLDLEAILGEFDVPPNTPYQLSDLDTMNPILTIGDKLKLIGEYEETIGTCLVFSEAATAPAAHEESGPSEENHIATQAPTKQVTPVASLHKILKFRLFIDNDDVQIANTIDETKASCS